MVTNTNTNKNTNINTNTNTYKISKAPLYRIGQFFPRQIFRGGVKKFSKGFKA